MAKRHQLFINIDLAGLTGRIQKHLQAIKSFVAIGLNAKKSIAAEDLQLPDVMIHHEFDSSKSWKVDHAREAWQTWILRNGFRDVAEAISGLLEETQKVLCYWQLAKGQETRALRGEDYNKLVVQPSSKFHRLGLPAKIDFLNKKYGLILNDALVQEILSINAARNCLVHRSGVVTSQDAGDGEQLMIKWHALVTVLIEKDVETELEPPYVVKSGGELGIATRHRTKSIPIGQLITVTANEFSEMCWTLFVFAQSCAQALASHGKAQGIQFGGKAGAVDEAKKKVKKRGR